MTKNIIKEIIIVLLLCLAIIFLLGILLYEHVPMTKTIPNAVSYSTPENIKEELEDSKYIDENQIIMTYEVDSMDLSNYTSTQNYKPGKANPFSSYETTQSTETNGTNTTTSNSQTEERKNSTQNSEKSNTKNSQTNTTTENTTNTNINTNTNTSTKTNTSGGQFFQDKGTK